MKQIKLSLYALIVLLTALWLMADTLAPAPLSYFAFRAVFMQYSGVIAIGAMSVAMWLALRPKFVEPYLDGLDKMYRLHKWLGIVALVVSVLHWWWATGSKWMIGWGWLERPVRGPRPAQTDLGLIEGWLGSQRGLAESVGEWAFYISLALIVLALTKWFPYHWFKKIHKWLAVAYLALVFHSLVLIKYAYWSQPVGWILAVLMLAGSLAAVLVLLGRVGSKRKVEGTVESLSYYPELRVLETRIALREGWPGHAAGQFVFVTSDPKEGAHPYTIASAWHSDERHLTFITKALGDHTSRLRDRLKLGAPVTIEGPYGCFDFDDQQPCQIWIGAGIGITPFVAAMKQRAIKHDDRPIYLFHSTSDFSQEAINKLTADAAAAGVRLHILVSAKDGRMDADHVRGLVSEWKTASVWFCGPPAFGQSLRDGFLKQGLSADRFHQELFQMR